MLGAARVLVLMTAYNAQEYLAEQLDSILSQEGVEVHLRISDDCSTDSTFRILETYADEYPNIELIYNTQQHGVPRSIMRMVYDAPADEFDFIALAGEREIWLPSKLRAACSHITANTSRPELYYAGVEYVDADGYSIGDVYQDYEVCAMHPASLLLVRNWAELGTMVMNGALVKLLRRRRVFDFGRSPAAWIHAVTLYCDGFVYCDVTKPCIVKEIDDPALLEHDPFSPEAARSFTTMAQVLLREYGRMMDPETARIVEAVASRHVSLKARRFLAGRNDIMLPTNSDTSKLKWRILRNKF